MNILSCGQFFAFGVLAVLTEDIISGFSYLAVILYVSVTEEILASRRSPIRGVRPSPYATGVPIS